MKSVSTKFISLIVLKWSVNIAIKLWIFNCFIKSVLQSNCYWGKDHSCSREA